MTVSTVAQDRVVKLPIPDGALMDGGDANADAASAAFGDLLAQLISGEGKGQDAELDDEGQGNGAEPAASTVTTTTAPSLTSPLQAVLAGALSSIQYDTKQDVQVAAAQSAETSSDVLQLAQLIAKSAETQSANPPVVDDGVGKEMPGIKAELQAWSDGPSAIAAMTSGAQEKRPMQLTVTGVETHFAPVNMPDAPEVPVNMKVAAASAVLQPELKRQLLPETVKTSAATVPSESAPQSADQISTTPKLETKSETPADGGGDGGGEAAKDAGFVGASKSKTASGKEADAFASDSSKTVDRSGMTSKSSDSAPVDATKVADGRSQVDAVTASTQQPDLPTPVAKQIAQTVVRALDGQVPHGVTVQQTDSSKTPLSKLKILHIELQPESLGSVTVRMELRADKLELKIEAARAETAELIQRDREVLSTLMRAAGYTADDAHIRVTHADPQLTVQASSNADGATNGGASQAGSQTAGGRSSSSNGGGDGGRREQRQENAPSGYEPPSGGRSEGKAGVYL